MMGTTHYLIRDETGSAKAIFIEPKQLRNYRGIAYVENSQKKISGIKKNSKGKYRGQNYSKIVPKNLKLKRAKKQKWRGVELNY